METKVLDTDAARIVCEGSFTLTASSVEDQAHGGGDAVALQIDAKGFQATPRGLGFALGTVIRWYIAKVDEFIPKDERHEQALAGVLSEVNGGIIQAIAAGETILSQQ